MPLPPDQPTEDDELLARYRNADFRGFDLFYRRNHSLIFKYLLARLGNRADAEEAFQETFLKLHRSIATYDPSQRALPWVFTIARNAALDAARKRKRNPTEESVDIPVAARAETVLIARQELERLVSGLAADDRLLLEQRFLDEASFDDIARDQGTTSANARQRLSRLLRRVRT